MTIRPNQSFLSIEIVSDVVCPWCFIGKRRLEVALRTYREQVPDDDPPAIHWLPFQLNPELPEEGIPRAEYLERKFGPGGVHNYSRTAEIGKKVGIDFAFDAIKIQPNTLNAHRLMAYAAKRGREDAVAERIFRAYFEEGADLTSTAQLAGIGETAGLERAALTTYLASDEDKKAVLDRDREIREAGINGVPFFIFNRRIAVSGAHEPETLLKAMIDAHKHWSTQPA